MADYNRHLEFSKLQKKNLTDLWFIDLVCPSSLHSTPLFVAATHAKGKAIDK